MSLYRLGFVVAYTADLAQLLLFPPLPPSVAAVAKAARRINFDLEVA